MRQSCNFECLIHIQIGRLIAQSRLHVNRVQCVYHGRTWHAIISTHLFRDHNAIGSLYRKNISLKKKFPYTTVSIISRLTLIDFDRLPEPTLGVLRMVRGSPHCMISMHFFAHPKLKVTKPAHSTAQHSIPRCRWGCRRNHSATALELVIVDSKTYNRTFDIRFYVLKGTYNVGILVTPRESDSFLRNQFERSNGTIFSIDQSNFFPYHFNEISIH